MHLSPPVNSTRVYHFQFEQRLACGLADMHPKSHVGGGVGDDS